MILLYWREFTKRKSIQGKLFVFLWNVSLHFSHTKGRTKTLGLVNPALLFLSPPSLPNSSSCVVFYWYFIGKGWSKKTVHPLLETGFNLPHLHFWISNILEWNFYVPLQRHYCLSEENFIEKFEHWYEFKLFRKYRLNLVYIYLYSYINFFWRIRVAKCHGYGGHNCVRKIGMLGTGVKYLGVHVCNMM